MSIDDLKRQNAYLIELVEEVIDYLEIPDRNCYCHLAPPCGDCVEYSRLREIVAEVKSLKEK